MAERLLHAGSIAHLRFQISDKLKLVAESFGCPREGEPLPQPNARRTPPRVFAFLRPDLR